MSDELGLYVVADGVGGRSRGEIASAEAVEQVELWIRRHAGELDRLLRLGDAGTPQLHRLLESGIQSACYMVYGLAAQDPEKQGMSTTISMLLVRAGVALFAQVGDSRIYRLRAGQVLQLTEDHTLVNHKLKQGLITAEEARTAKGKNVITRAVGNKDYVQVDTGVIPALPGDRYLVCSDGLHGYLGADEEIADLMATEPLAQAADRAITLANERGGKDNVTAVFVSVED